MNDLLSVGVKLRATTNRSPLDSHWLRLYYSHTYSHTN